MKESDYASVISLYLSLFQSLSGPQLSIFCFAFSSIDRRRFVSTPGQADSLAKGSTEIHIGPYAAAITPVHTQMKPASDNKNSGTDEPVCRAGIETQTQNGHVDTAGEGRVRRIGRVALTYIRCRV